jgi:hypothetical protein
MPGQACMKPKHSEEIFLNKCYTEPTNSPTCEVWHEGLQ